jgi:hypothetical protein
VACHFVCHLPQAEKSSFLKYWKYPREVIYLKIAVDRCYTHAFEIEKYVMHGLAIAL